MCSELGLYYPIFAKLKVESNHKEYSPTSSSRRSSSAFTFSGVRAGKAESEPSSSLEETEIRRRKTFSWRMKAGSISRKIGNRQKIQEGRQKKDNRKKEKENAKYENRMCEKKESTEENIRRKRKTVFKSRKTGCWIKIPKTTNINIGL